MMWPGVEPEKGAFNETYLTLSKNLINALGFLQTCVVQCVVNVHICSAGSHGIYTLLDMHQDVLSDKFCGEGIPDWAVDTGSQL